MKLYGRCKAAGKCICGRCAAYPYNVMGIVIIKIPDGYGGFYIRKEVARMMVTETIIFGNAKRKRRQTD